MHLWHAGTEMEYLEHLDPNLDRIFHYQERVNTLLQDIAKTYQILSFFCLRGVKGALRCFR